MSDLIVGYIVCEQHQVHHHPEIECPLCETMAKQQPRSRQQRDGAKGARATLAKKSIAHGIPSHRADVGLLFRGERRTMADWCRRLQLERRTVEGRLAANWTVAEALGTPVGEQPSRQPAQQVGRLKGVS